VLVILVNLYTKPQDSLFVVIKNGATDCAAPFNLIYNENRFGMVFFTPVNCRESTFGAMVIHTINLTLGLRFGEVRVMHPNLILKLRVNCEGHLRIKSVKKGATDCAAPFDSD